MSARLIDACDAGFLAGLGRHPHGSLFGSPPWVEVLARTYGFNVSATAVATNGSGGGTLLFCRVSDLRGERVLSLPFCDYCDPLVLDPAAWPALIAPVLALGAPVTLRCLRNAIPCHDPRFTLVKQGAWHGVDLARPEAAVWAGLAGSARQNVHKARRHGVQVRAGRSLEDVRLFYRMHCRLRKEKYRLLPQPAAFFEHLHAMFAPGDRLTVLLAEVEGQPVAGILLLEWGDTLYYKFNASLDQRFCPNDLLAWEALRLGQSRGLARLDLGFSDLDQPGLVRYKRKFATDAGTISVLRSVPAGHADRNAQEVAEMLGRMTRLLTDRSVPDAITQVAGDQLYRYFC